MQGEPVNLRAPGACWLPELLSRGGSPSTFPAASSLFQSPSSPAALQVLPAGSPGVWLGLFAGGRGACPWTWLDFWFSCLPEPSTCRGCHGLTAPSRSAPPRACVSVCYAWELWSLCMFKAGVLHAVLGALGVSSGVSRTLGASCVGECVWPAPAAGASPASYQGCQGAACVDCLGAGRLPGASSGSRIMFRALTLRVIAQGPWALGRSKGGRHLSWGAPSTLRPSPRFPEIQCVLS